MLDGVELLVPMIEELCGLVVELVGGLVRWLKVEGWSSCSSRSFLVLL